MSMIEKNDCQQVYQRGRGYEKYRVTSIAVPSASLRIVQSRNRLNTAVTSSSEAALSYFKRLLI